MKIAEGDRQITTNMSGADSFDFRLASNATIFAILRDKMYKDPVGSIVREILTNAVDAHKAEGSEADIEVWPLDRELVIRDHGVGMSPDSVREIYSVYGQSSKATSNTEHGGFGLGAKTPFAYTDSFHVITYWEGIRHEYLMYIDESEKGKIQPLSAREEVGRGTTVKIPLKPQDVPAFRNAIIKYTRFLPVPVRVIGHNLIVERPVPIFEEPTWAYYGKDVGCNILLDGIPYTYGRASIPKHTVLRFQIGDLAPSATREEIQVTDRNTAKITERLATFKSQVGDHVRRQILAEPDFGRALALIHGAPPGYDQYAEHFYGGGRIVIPMLEMGDIGFSFGGRLSKNITTNPREVRPESFILTDFETIDRDSIQYANAAKVRQHLQRHNLQRVYIVNGKHDIPEAYRTPLSSLKVVRTKRPPKEKPAAKTHFYARDINRKMERVAVSDGRRRIKVPFGERLKWSRLYEFPLPIFYLGKACMKLVQGVPEWIDFHEYVADFLKKHEANLQALADGVASQEANEKFTFLEPYVCEEARSCFTPVGLTREEAKLIKFLEGNYKVEGHPRELTDHYPLLGLGDPGLDEYPHCIEYVKLINQKHSQGKKHA